MKFISFIGETNYFTSFVFDINNFSYNLYTDLNDLLENINTIEEEYLLIIEKDYGLSSEFINYIENVKNLKKNSILASINLLKPEDRFQKKLIPFVSHIGTSNFETKKINAIYVKKNDALIKLKNKNIKNFIDFTFAFQYDFISTIDLVVKIKYDKNKIDTEKGLLLNYFRNKQNIINSKNIKNDYYELKKNKIISEHNYDFLVKLYQELHQFKLNITIIDCSNLKNDITKILNQYVKSELNFELNYVVILGSLNNIKIKKLKSKIIEFQTFDYVKLYEVFEKQLNYDVYFVNDLSKLQLITKSKLIKNTELYFNQKEINLSLMKTKLYKILFLNLEFDNFQNYINKLGVVFYYYLQFDIFIHNYPNSILPTLDRKFNLKPNIDIIDLLFERKNYDECCILLNIIIRNRISYNYTFIFKVLVIIDKINLIISDQEIVSLLGLIENESFEDIFQISVILIHNKMFEITNDFLTEHINEFVINTDNIFKYIFLLYHLKYFKSPINLINDRFIVPHLIDNFDYILNNINLINELDNTVDSQDLIIEILTYLNHRNELIDNKCIITNISNKIDNYIFNFNNLEKIEKNIILDKFFKHPNHILYSFNILSDFMISEEDILLKRKNCNIILDILLENYDDNKDKFQNVFQKNILNKTDTLFRYAYHGLSNKIFFKNCINFSYKLIESTIIETKKGQDLLKFQSTEKNIRKICFISNFLTRTHSVFKDRHQVIKHLIKKGFEVYIATFQNLDFKFSQIFTGIKENIILSKNNVYGNVMKLRSYQFHKLVFCEIGMDIDVVNMAYFRMAQKQYNTWGHSDTSGFPEIDFFVSSELYELPYEESKEHYSEKLILQKGLCTCYVNPTDKYTLILPRSFYGLSNFEKIVCCPQSLFKIHPKFDFYLFEILKQNIDSCLVFIDNEGRKTKMYERWNKVLKDMPQYYGVLSRVKFIPSMNHEKFCNLMKVSDVMIDPYPFGGCNSSLESFSLGKPLVTQPSIRINGRFTYGFYKRMGFMDLVANNMEEYVSLTTRLLQDKDFHQEMTDKIMANKDKLFMDQQTLDEWEELMAEE